MMVPRPYTRVMIQPQSRMRPATYLLAGLVLCVSYFISSYLIDLYTGGDRLHYRRFFELSSNVDLNLNALYIKQVFDLQRTNTGSGEPLYGVLVWISSHFITNEIFVNTTNALLSYLLFIYMYRYKVSFITYAMVFTNFYFIVLLTGAERLKFSTIIVLIGLVSSRKIIKVISLSLAPLFHVQTLILYSPVFITDILLGGNRSFWAVGKFFSRRNVIIISSFCFFAIIFFLRDYIIKKAYGYSTNSQSDLFNITVLTAISFMTFGRNLNPSIAVASLSMIIIVVGDSRVNMIGYMIYLYYCFEHRKANSVFFILISLYFSYKSISFVDKIIQYGDGFLNV